MNKAYIKAELEAFIKSGKAKSEVNSGNFVTTHIDSLKVAEHFYEQAEKDFMEKAEEWLIENINDYIIADLLMMDMSFLRELKKAMSE